MVVFVKNKGGYAVLAGNAEKKNLKYIKGG